jgi:hypothetical protein
VDVKTWPADSRLLLADGASRRCSTHRWFSDTEGRWVDGA